MIVADANLLAYLLLPGERTQQAEEVYRRDPLWVVPRLCLSELRSVFLKEIRGKRLSVAGATALATVAEELVGGREAAPESALVLALAAGSACSAYDCEYLALAKELGVPLVTSDRRILREFPRLAVNPAEFLGTG